MRVAYLGRDLFAPCLQALIDAGHAIVDLRTTHGRGPTLSERIHQIAAAHALPLSVGDVGPGEMRGIADGSPDVLVCAGWPRRLPDPAQLGLRGVNVHPALLPDGRGPWPLPHVILKGLDRAGVTVHRLTARFDAGPILAQRAFAVPPWFDLDDLLRRARQTAARLLVETLADFDALWAAAQPQGAGTWWPKLARADRALDWRLPAEIVLRRARAFGRDGVFGMIDGRERRLLGLDLASERGEPGTVLARSGARVRIAAVEGSIDFAVLD